MDFLSGIFQLYDLDNDEALRPAELDDLFQTAPDSPWLEVPYKDTAEKTSGGNLTINGFLAEVLGSNDSTRSSKKFDQCHDMQQMSLISLGVLRKPSYCGKYHKTIKKFLASLAACDVAVVVYDSSDVYSWKKAREILMEVARRGEESGYGTPCLLVAAKDDLDPYPMSVQESDMVCMELGIDVPLSLSMKLGDPNSLFSRIVSTPENPHSSIPETASGRRSKNIRQVMNSSLLFVSVGTALGFAGLAAYSVRIRQRRRLEDLSGPPRIIVDVFSLANSSALYIIKVKPR